MVLIFTFAIKVGCISDPEGKSNYYIDNRSEYNLEIDFSGTKGMVERIANEVQAGHRTLFARDRGIAGVLPNESFHELILYLRKDSDLFQIYSQNPICNGLWSIEEIGKYDRNCTLIVYNDDLTLPGLLGIHTLLAYSFDKMQ